MLHAVSPAFMVCEHGHVPRVKATDYAVIQTVIVRRVVPPLQNPSTKLYANSPWTDEFTTYNKFTHGFFWLGVSQLLLFQAPSLCGLWLPRSKYLDHSLWWLARSIATRGYGWCCRHQCGFLINEALWWQMFLFSLGYESIWILGWVLVVLRRKAACQKASEDRQYVVIDLTSLTRYSIW